MLPSMRAIRVHAPGGPEQMQLDELPTPHPGPREALVRGAAAGVNFIDVYHRSGLYPGTGPRPLGVEGAGTIEALGPDVDPALGLAAGSQVAWSGISGSYATHLLAPAARLVPVPGGMTLAQAAAAMLQGMTAH